MNNYFKNLIPFILVLLAVISCNVSKDYRDMKDCENCYFELNPEDFRKTLYKAESGDIQAMDNLAFHYGKTGDIRAEKYWWERILILDSDEDIRPNCNAATRLAYSAGNGLVLGGGGYGKPIQLQPKNPDRLNELEVLMSKWNCIEQDLALTE